MPQNWAKAFILRIFNRSPVGVALLLAALIFLLLEVWRPYYYLTDDNLSVGLPFFTEMGRHLKSGQSPFYSDYLFGGHYYLLRDANFFSWSPLNFLVSLLADTPGRFGMLDLLAFINILLATSGFMMLGLRLREDLHLGVSNGRLIFCTFSFVFSTFALTCGASWENFLANQAVLPWLILGIWLKSWRHSLGVLVLFSLHQDLSGQSAGTISNGIILTLFAGLLAAQRRSFMPLARWFSGNLVAVVIILPILMPALSGFLHSPRGEGLSVPLLNKFSMPAAMIPISLFFGNLFEMAAWFAHVSPGDFFLFPRTPTLLACGAAWCIFPLLCQWRRWTHLELSCALLMGLLLVLVVRPIVITEAMSHVPFLRSMRWPFREILELLFFFHLLLMIRPWGGSVAFQNRLACASFAIFFVPLCFTHPLTFNALDIDRTAVLSGDGERFWSSIKRMEGPNLLIATTMEPEEWNSSKTKAPYSYCGTANFPAYFQVRSISGYSQTAPLNQLPIPVRAYFWFGTYETNQNRLLSRVTSLTVLQVTSINPLHFMLTPPGQKPRDVTPLLPALVVGQ